MEDEKGMDEKVICVLEEDAANIQNVTDLDRSILENIYTFFSNYKNDTPGKWSRVLGYEDKDYAIKLYEKSIIQ
jgi:inorganic pyrophosphatase